MANATKSRVAWLLPTLSLPPLFSTFWGMPLGGMTRAGCLQPYVHRTPNQDLLILYETTKHSRSTSRSLSLQFCSLFSGRVRTSWTDQILGRHTSQRPAISFRTETRTGLCAPSEKQHMTLKKQKLAKRHNCRNLHISTLKSLLEQKYCISTGLSVSLAIQFILVG